MGIGNNLPGGEDLEISDLLGALQEEPGAEVASVLSSAGDSEGEEPLNVGDAIDALVSMAADVENITPDVAADIKRIANAAERIANVAEKAMGAFGGS